MSRNDAAGDNAAAEASLWTSDDDLTTFALPASSSSRDLQNLVRRYPLIALIAAIWLGIGIGKMTRFI